MGELIDFARAVARAGHARSAEMQTVEIVVESLDTGLRRKPLPGKPLDLTGHSPQELGELLTGATGHAPDWVWSWLDWVNQCMRLEQDNIATVIPLLNAARLVRKMHKAADATKPEGKQQRRKLSGYGRLLHDYLQEHWGAGDIPEEARDLQPLARRICTDLNVLPNEWRDPRRRMR